MHEDFSWSRLAFCLGHAQAIIHLASHVYRACLLPTLCQAQWGGRAVQAVSVLSGGLEICWGGEIHLYRWTTKELMDLGKQIHTNGVSKIKGKSGTGNLIFRSGALPPVSLLLRIVISLEWDRGPSWGSLISCSTGGHLIYVQIFPVSGNLLPVKEGLLEQFFILNWNLLSSSFSPADIRPALRVNIGQIPNPSPHTTAL